MTAHSRIGASSMYRWSQCPGSVRLCDGVESKASEYAEEGSDAHHLAALCLANVERPEIYAGKTLVRDGRSFAVDRAMAEAVAVYVEHVQMTHRAGDVELIEHQFDLSSVHPGLFGTADNVVWRDSEKRLTVRDYKHGAGILVSPVANPQLLYYGLGALMSSGYPAARVRLEVIQPRCGDPENAIRSWEIDSIDLLDFADDLKRYAVAAEAPDAPLAPGDHCRFCPAAAHCPALSSRSQEIARLEFAPALSYDPAKLKLALDSLPVLEAFVKNVREFAYAEAEAGRCPPGYKLVAKRATRRWRSEAEVVEHLQDLGIGDDLIYAPREIKSPAQMEKVKQIGRKTLDEFVVAESSGHALASESDPRPPVRLDAKAEFAALPAA